jgi:hypothetical protein
MLALRDLTGLPTTPALHERVRGVTGFAAGRLLVPRQLEVVP